MNIDDELIIRSLAALGRGTIADVEVEQHFEEFRGAYAKVGADLAVVAQLNDAITDLDRHLRSRSSATDIAGMLKAQQEIPTETGGHNETVAYPAQARTSRTRTLTRSAAGSADSRPSPVLTAHPPTTTELLRGVERGDQGAWEQLVHRFEPAVTAAIRAYRLQEADARDAAQRTWLQLIEHHRRLRDPEALEGWLTTTARRECLRTLRTRWRCHVIDADAGADRPDPTCDIEQRVVDADTARQLRQLMTLLPARSGMLLSSLYRENPPADAELSRRTGIPVGSIGPTRARALQQLRRLIEAGQPEDAASTPHSAG
jgi:RNA polymerase sigma factor (sigma-70 family)